MFLTVLFGVQIVGAIMSGEKFGELVNKIGFAGAAFFILFCFMVWLIRFVFNNKDKIHEIEMNRQVEEKRWLLEKLIKQIPSSSNNIPSLETVKNEIMENEK